MIIDDLSELLAGLNDEENKYLKGIWKQHCAIHLIAYDTKIRIVYYYSYADPEIMLTVKIPKFHYNSDNNPSEIVACGTNLYGSKAMDERFYSVAELRKAKSETEDKMSALLNDFLTKYGLSEKHPFLTAIIKDKDMKCIIDIAI